MSIDDEKARKARADRIHKQIDRLKSGDQNVPKSDSKDENAKESPRDFVERRTNDLGRGGSKPKKE